MKHKILVGTLAIAACALLPIAALAAVTPESWINGILTRFLSLIVWPIFAAVIVLMLIWAGFLFVTAHGEPTKIDKAKKTVIWALVGIAVGIFAYSAYSIVSSVIVDGGAGGGGAANNNGTNPPGGNLQQQPRNIPTGQACTAPGDCVSGGCTPGGLCT